MEGSIQSYKRILITGGTSGLGLELVKMFLSGSCEVYAAGRNPERLPLLNDKLHFIAVDFSDLKAVSEATNKLIVQSIKFDLIINNAGILSPPAYTTTKDGFEYTFQVNFLAHLLIDDLIMRNIDNKTELTVVSVTSPAYKYVKPEFRIPDQSKYRSSKTYAESKLYLLLIGEYLRKKYPEKQLKYLGCNPGIFSSDIHRMQKKWFRDLYKIAAPFMRGPGKVAKSLCGILSNRIFVDNVIYNIKAEIKPIPFTDSGQATALFTDCEKKLAGFLTKPDFQSSDTLS